VSKAKGHWLLSISTELRHLFPFTVIFDEPLIKWQYPALHLNLAVSG